MKYRIPSTWLSYQSKTNNEVYEQSRFIAWEGNDKLRLLDVNSETHIVELMKIP